MTADYGPTHMGSHIYFYYRPATLLGMSTIGSRIRDRRKELNLTQAEVATAIGLDQSSVSDIETKGAEFSARVLIKLSEVLNAPPEYIMYGGSVAEIDAMEILSIYRALDGAKRGMLLEMVRPLKAVASSQTAPRGNRASKP